MTGQDITTAGLIPTSVAGLMCASEILGRRLVVDLHTLDWAVFFRELVTGKRWRKPQVERKYTSGHKKKEALDENMNAVPVAELKNE